MYLNACISITCISITPTLLIIIRYCCGKQCELLLNRFLIKDLHHILNLLRHLPLSSTIDDKIRPTPLFQLRVKKIDPLPLLSTPQLQKISTPHLHFYNSITATTATSLSIQALLQLSNAINVCFHTPSPISQLTAVSLCSKKSSDNKL